jgi:hypothetical protein
MTTNKKYLTFSKQKELKDTIRKGKRSAKSVMDQYGIGRSTYYRYQQEVLNIFTAVNRPDDPLVSNFSLVDDIVSADDPSFETSRSSGPLIGETISSTRKKYQKPKYHEVEQSIYKKFMDFRDMGYPVSGPLLRFMAKREAAKLISQEFSKQLVSKYRDATFGRSWLSSFKQRHNIRGNIKINGERASLPSDVDRFMGPILDAIRALNIPPCNIYNWDETGLFYRAMPRYTLASISDDGAGSKEDKLRITAMISVNGDGSDTTLVLIGKSKTPCGCNEEYWRNHGVDYYFNSKAWMTGQIFKTLLRKFDERVCEPTILLIDNFRGHNVEELEDYNLIIPIFLPANTTSKTQPLDAGIISNWKVS